MSLVVKQKNGWLKDFEYEDDLCWNLNSVQKSAVMKKHGLKDLIEVYKHCKE